MMRLEWTRPEWMTRQEWVTMQEWMMRIEGRTKFREGNIGRPVYIKSVFSCLSFLLSNHFNNTDHTHYC